MFGTHFYHETVKRSVSIFGTLFNNITIKKTKSDGTVLSQQIVPISYGPKQKWLESIKSPLNDAKENSNDVKRNSILELLFLVWVVNCNAGFRRGLFPWRKK